jgi:solute carrier family 25 carnitine/acylcarnitine transporter 20/29
MLGATTLNAVLFGTYGTAQRFFVAPTPTKPTVRPGDLSLGQIWLCGFAAGSCVSLIESPDDLLKVKVQAQVGRARTPGSYSGVFDAARKIIVNHGLRGMYQGWPATILRNAPGCANSLMVYEMCMRTWGGAPSPESQAAAAAAGLSTEVIKEAPLAVSAAAGAAAGLGFWAFTYPLEMIKTRLQADASAPSQRHYRSWLHCARETYGELGLKGMYRGFAACQLRGIVVNAAVFVTVEAWQRTMRQQRIAHPLEF